MFHSRCFIGFRQTCCAVKWKYKIIRIRHAMKWALVSMNITDLKQPLTDCIICLRWHFNKLLSSDINFHQDPTWHEINEKAHWMDGRSHNDATPTDLLSKIDSMLPCVYSVIHHRGCQNVVRTKKWHTRRGWVCHWCSYHILASSVIYYWTEARQLGIYLFYVIKNLKSFMRGRKRPQL